MSLANWPVVTDDAGTKRDGTIFNKGLTDAIKASVENDIVPTGPNAAVKAKTITDEVVAARNGQASLSAYLALLAASFTTGVTTTAQTGSQVFARNLINNGGLEQWNSGASAAPDDATLTSLTIAQTATTFSASSKGTGQYVARLTRAGGINGSLKWLPLSSYTFANINRARGETVTALMSCIATSGNQVRLVIDDGVVANNSAYHTGDGTVQDLIVTAVLDSGSTKLEIRCEVNNVNGSVDVGGFMCGFGDVAVTHWSPATAIPMASSTAPGLLSIGPQNIVGLKTFGSPPVGLPTFARVSGADIVVNNSTVFVNVTGLSFNINPNEVWIAHFRLWCIATNAANIKFTFTGPAAPTAVRFGAGNWPTGTMSASAFGTGVSQLQNSVDSYLEVALIVRNGANPGTVQLQMAQLTADVSNTKVYQESYMEAWRIS